MTTHESTIRIDPGLLRWEWWGALACVIAGSVPHFAYAWSGASPVVGLFTPVNESVWEHLKLGLWPLGVLSVIELLTVARGRRRFLLPKLAGIVAMMLFIVLFYYGYSAILGTHLLALDIGSFVACVALCQAVSLAIMRAGGESSAGNALGAAGLVALAALFMIFTFAPPRSELFSDPPSGTHGAGQTP